MTQIKQIRQQLVREARVQGLPTEEQLARNFSKVSRLLEGGATLTTSSILVTTTEVLASKTALWSMALLLGGGLLGGHVLYHAADSEFADGHRSDQALSLNQEQNNDERPTKQFGQWTRGLDNGTDLLDSKSVQLKLIEESVARTKGDEQDSTLSQDSVSVPHASKAAHLQNRHEDRKRERNGVRSGGRKGNSDAKVVKSDQVAPKLAQTEIRYREIEERHSPNVKPEKLRVDSESHFDSVQVDSTLVDKNLVVKPDTVSSEESTVKKSRADPPKAQKSTLSEETRLISLARDAKEQGKFRRAKMWLRMHRRRFPSGQLVEERMSLMRVIEGLVP